MTRAMINDTSFVNKWNNCLTTIKDNVPEQTYKTWFQSLKPLKYEDNTLYIKVGSQFVYEFLEERFADLLRKVMDRHFGSDINLTYQVVVDSNNDGTVMYPNDPANSSQAKVMSKNIPEKPAVDFDSHLNQRCNFNNFIEGMSNKLARTVSEAVSNDPGKTAFNPLFIYGSSGVGKTHLVNAIGMKIKELYPTLRVLYISARLFQVQYTESIRNNTTNDFINFYQTVDVLIIDDIQEFAGVTKTQNTFFHIFNQLRQNGKQLVMTADRAPVLLQGLEDRLITRFKWGMVAELEKPSIDLRREILKDKIRRDGLKFPIEVIDYIAENVCDSIRDLEGIVISIMAQATIFNKDVDLVLAQQIVRNFIKIEDKVITVEDIIQTVCKHYGLEANAIQTKSRKREIVQARQIAMYLAKTYTEFSTAKIGVLIGNRDHATVHHACKTVSEQRDIDKKFKSELDNIQMELKKR